MCLIMVRLVNVTQWRLICRGQIQDSIWVPLKRRSERGILILLRKLRRARLSVILKPFEVIVRHVGQTMALRSN